MPNPPSPQEMEELIKNAHMPPAGQKTANGFFSRSKQEEQLPYMNRVDAALLRKPRFGPLLLSIATCTALFAFVLWASLAKIDEVARGQGQVIASQRTQVISNLEGGIIQEIMVREGQTVQKDQALMRLSNEMAESVFRDAGNKILENKATIIRLEAELQGHAPSFPADLVAKAPQIVEGQKTLYASRQNQRQAELSMLEFQHQQRQHEVKDLMAKKHELESALVVQQRQVEIAKGLLDQKNYAEMTYLDLQQKLISLQGSIDSVAVAIPKAQAAAHEAEQKNAVRRAELDSLAAEELAKRNSELASLQQTLAAGSDRVVRKEVRAPVRGIVKQIMNNTVGGVIKPGETIMEIVPLDDSLIIEARIKPSDIAFIRPQQKATVKITAYDSSIYGSLSGQVERISADTIEDKRGETFYLVQVRTTENSIVYHGKSLPIIPGMIASIDILTGQKTVMDYILKPILKASQNALHER